ncbi:putative phospholipase B-like 2 [Rhipicephalus microplus]|uniref:putative phospholipase B-like 2 n=1 Tax=Rhipicephalus microplus TaxID=6941 RepID=UPI003F6AF330
MCVLSLVLALSLVSGIFSNDCRCAWVGYDKQQRLAIHQGLPADTSPDAVVVPAAWACFQDRIHKEGLLSAIGDLLELEMKFGRFQNIHSLRTLTCSALIKMAPGNRDIYFAHTSWFTYKSMLRIQKMYKFHWHTVMQRNLKGYVVPGHTITMSSYPGCLNSFDDFHLTSSGLAVMETSLKNTNHQLLQHIRPNSSPLTWVRNMVASRLATNGSQWTAIFSRFNSGT